MLEHESVRRKRRIDLGIVFLFIIILILIAASVFVYFQVKTDILKEEIKKGRSLKILFSISNDNEPLFFELFMFNANTGRASVLYIPPNVGMLIDTLKRVDSLSVLYNRRDFKPLLKEMSKLLGTKVNYYIDIGETEVSRLVDLLGGIEVFIPNPVDITYQGRKILLPSGSVLLDGDKTVDFFTYSMTHEPEMDRIGRRQRFLQSLLKSLSDKSYFITRSEVFSVFKSFLLTNLSSKSIKTFVLELDNMDSERLIFQRVLGNVRKLDGKNLLFPHYNGELLKEKVKQTLKTISSKEMGNNEDLTVTIEILNGTNINGLAARTREIYQSFGYDVISIGNADNNQYLHTVVLDRKGKIEVARKVAAVIHCKRVYTRFDPNLDESIEVTVILGKDFDGRYCRE